MKVLIAASELTPIAKVGGLGDVIGALPKALFEDGVDVSVILPKYGMINDKKYNLKKSDLELEVVYKDKSRKVSLWQATLPESKVRIYFLENKKYLSSGKKIYFSKTAFVDSWEEIHRFVFFSKAVAELLKKRKFDLLHAQDWHTGKLVSIAKIPTLFTIHNIANQGEMGRGPNYMQMGIENATLINTVSPTYAKELLEPEFGKGLQGELKQRKDRLFGILNGIDTEFFNPKTDKYIFENYDWKKLGKKTINKTKLQKELGLRIDKNSPVMGLVSRLTKQKAIDLFELVVPKVLIKYKDAQFIFLGQGSKKYEKVLKDLAEEYPENVSTNLKFDPVLARKIYAASDIFLMPSRFEPCGLGQMIAMRYGTLPVVRKTGGLKDTVHEGKEGFVFERIDSRSFLKALKRALKMYQEDHEGWEKMQKKVMQKDFSWKKSAKEYIELYKKAIKIYGKE